MLENGVRTGMVLIPLLLRQILQDLQRARGVYFVVAVGRTVVGIAALLIEIVVTRSLPTTLWDFGWSLSHSLMFLVFELKSSPIVAIFKGKQPSLCCGITDF